MVSVLTPKRLARMPVGSLEQAISTRTAGVVRALGWITSIRRLLSPAALETIEAPGIFLDRPTHLIPATFRRQTIKVGGRRSSGEARRLTVERCAQR